MVEHDKGYKLLFSHTEMVEGLLRGFVREEWVAALDFSTLEKMSGSYVSEDLRGREDDVVWRVRWGEDWLYVYILLEFQSTVDTYMAVRIMTYVGMLYQDLVRKGMQTRGRKLPPVLPVVLYNGEERWTATTEMSELVEEMPGGLRRYCPRMTYLLLDEGRYAKSELEEVRNVVSALFRLENSETEEDVAEVLVNLTKWLQAPEQSSLRRAFVVWMKRVLFPSRFAMKEIPDIKELEEVKEMLSERVKRWYREEREAGYREGMSEGIEQGIERGIEQGIERGIERGIEQGRTAGLRLGLLHLLERKFGPLTKEAKMRLEIADQDTLLRWGERILTAERLEDVLNE